MRNRHLPLAVFPFLTLVLSGCGGGSSQQGSVGTPSIAQPHATAGRADIVGGDGSPATADSVPVSVRISAAQGSIPVTEVIGYSVYRQIDGDPSTPTLLTTQQTAGPLLVYDNALPIGTRADYKIVLNYTTGQAADGTSLLKSELLPSTNFVTQIEPTENANVTPTGTGIVSVSVPATQGADDYVLSVSAEPAFNSRQNYTPSSKGPYTAPTDSPRHGTTVTFGPLNVAQAFPGATTLHLRVGARDSRNGTSESSNFYVFTDSQQFTTP